MLFESKNKNNNNNHNNNNKININRIPQWCQPLGGETRVRMCKIRAKRKGLIKKFVVLREIKANVA